MIRTRQIPFDELLKQVPENSKVGILGCGDCAAVLNTGGTRQVEELAAKLAGRNLVAFQAIVESPCDQRVLRRLIKFIPCFDDVSFVIALACPAGIQSLSDLVRARDERENKGRSGNDDEGRAKGEGEGESERKCERKGEEKSEEKGEEKGRGKGKGKGEGKRKGKTVIAGLTASGLALVTAKGLRQDACIFCPTCSFDFRKGFCPIARCPLRKGDGPCQNRLSEDLCPVSPGLRCIWLECEDGGPETV